MRNIFYTLTLTCFIFFSCENSNHYSDEIENQLYELIISSNLNTDILLIDSITSSQIKYEITDGFEFAFAIEFKSVKEVYRGDLDGALNHKKTNKQTTL